VIGEVDHLVGPFDPFIGLVPIQKPLLRPLEGLVKEAILYVLILNDFRLVIIKDLPRVKDSFEVTPKATDQQCGLCRNIPERGNLLAIFEEQMRELVLVLVYHVIIYVPLPRGCPHVQLLRGVMKHLKKASLLELFLIEFEKVELLRVLDFLPCGLEIVLIEVVFNIYATLLGICQVRAVLYQVDPVIIFRGT
jgi:hypothetical protein